jgi:SAM-dependent methyltransferase
MITQSCSFCGSSDLRGIKTTSRATLLGEYEKLHGLSFPRPILETNFAFEALITYKCEKCGTRSYHPNILGNSNFYDYLSRNLRWYYLENRWEFQIAAGILDEEQTRLFLEIGCGDGHFLSLARNRGHEGHGSEINPRSLEILNSKGFQVLTDQDVQRREYDAVVMFQLLEHLLDPFSFMKSIVPHVRNGGVIIVSTPVTPSCCASVSAPPLLLPPHHQWMPTTLGHRMLAERLGLICEKVVYDSPNPGQIVTGLRRKLGWLTPLLDRYNGFAWDLGQLILRIGAAMRYDWATVGHTILVVLRKP